MKISRYSKNIFDLLSNSEAQSIMVFAKGSGEEERGIALFLRMILNALFI